MNDDNYSVLMSRVGTVVKGSAGGNACSVHFDGDKHVSIVLVYDLELV